MSKMIEVYVVAEGQTEQTFIRDVLAPELGNKGIALHPALIGKPGKKGGNVLFSRAKEDIEKFLKQRCDTFITTMFDFFRIDKAWPGDPSGLKNMTAHQKGIAIECATLGELEKEFPQLNVAKRVIPYIEMHEFEALLFSSPSVLANKIAVEEKTIAAILVECVEPEEINDRPEHAPSKRLEKLKPGYRKVAMGKNITEAIGVRMIRSKCLHFDAWIKKLEALAE